MGVGFITRRGGKPIKEKHYLEFSGSNSYVNLGNAFYQPNNSPFSITGDMMLYSTSSRDILMCRNDAVRGGSPYAWIFGFINSAETLGLYDGGSWRTFACSVNNNQWYNIACTYNGTTLRVYIDGTEIGSVNISYSDSTNYNTQIGGYTSSTGDINGRKKNVSFWNKALTVQEIQDYMANPPSGQEPGIVAYYDFSDGSGSTLTDTAGTNDGTIVGATWGDYVIVDGIVYVKEWY